MKTFFLMFLFCFLAQLGFADEQSELFRSFYQKSKQSIKNGDQESVRKAKEEMNKNLNQQALEQQKKSLNFLKKNYHVKFKSFSEKNRISIWGDQSQKETLSVQKEEVQKWNKDIKQLDDFKKQADHFVGQEVKNTKNILSFSAFDQIVQSFKEKFSSKKLKEKPIKQGKKATKNKSTTQKRKVASEKTKGFYQSGSRKTSPAPTSSHKPEQSFSNPNVSPKDIPKEIVFPGVLPSDSYKKKQ